MNARSTPSWTRRRCLAGCSARSRPRAWCANSGAVVARMSEATCGEVCQAKGSPRISLRSSGLRTGLLVQPSLDHVLLVLVENGADMAHHVVGDDCVAFRGRMERTRVERRI